MSKDILSTTLAELNKGTGAPENKGEELTVEAANIGFLMNNLSDLYADGEYAAFRETLANAIDSHVGYANNQDDFIEVTFPKSEQNNLISFQDRGSGMSREEVVTRLLRFGNSSKKGSLEEAGEYGYGAKSPLAAASWFHVYSVKDGQRNSLRVSKDELDQNAPPRFFWDDDCLDAGVETDEPNGVRISYPMKIRARNPWSMRADEPPSWRPSAFQTLGLPLNRIKFDGEVHVTSIHNTELFTPIESNGETLLWVANGKHESLHEISEEYLYVELGSVIYKLKSSIVEMDPNLRMLRTWKNLVVLRTSNQLVEVVPSRDSLRYSEKTINNLKNLAHEAVQVLFHKEQLKVNRAETKLDALQHYSKLVLEDYPSVADLAYKNFGKMSEAITSILNILPSAGYRGLLYGKWFPNAANNRRKLEWVKVDQNNIHRILSENPSLGIYNIGYVADETAVKASMRKAFRNSDIIGRFVAPNADPAERENLRNETILLSTSLISLSPEENLEAEEIGLAEVESDNAWWNECFFDTISLDEAILDARVRVKQYNRENNIQPARRAAAAAATRGRKAVFTVLTIDDETYTLTPYERLTDLTEIGHYYIASDTLDYSVIDFDNEAHGSGETRLLPTSLRALYEYATSRRFSVVVRTPRQKVLDLGTYSYQDVREYIIENFINGKLPKLTSSEIILLLKHMGYNYSYELDGLIKAVVPNQIHPRDSFMRTTVSSVNDSLRTLSEDEVKQIFPDEFLQLISWKQSETAKQLGNEHSDKLREFRNAWYSRYVRNFHVESLESFHSEEIVEAVTILEEETAMLKKYLLVIKAMEALQYGREKLGDEVFDSFLNTIKQLVNSVE